MDVATIAAVATEMSQAESASAIQLAVLKRAMNIQAAGAAQLVEAAAQVINNPPHLGNVIDTLA